MTIQKLIVATDYSEQANVAIEHAVAVARKTGAEVIIMHALGLSQADPSMPYPVAIPEVYAKQVAEIRKDEREKLANLASSYAESGVNVSSFFSEEMPEEGIVDAAEETQSDLIVVGSHGRKGLSRFLLGSVAERVAKKANCDVLVAREETPKNGYKHILVPTDFSAVSDMAMARAMELVADGGTIELFHCWQLPGGPVTYWGKVGPGLRENIKNGAQEYGEKSIKKFARDNVNFVFKAQEGDARHELEDRIDEGGFDLVVMGTHGRRGLQRMILGSVTESIIRHTKKSVYMVRSPEIETK